MLYSSEDLFYCASLAVYVAVSLVVAIVRWGHKCEPYARHKDYFFPAWKEVVGCFLSTLLLLPCIVMPQDHDAQIQVRIMLILASPFYSAVIMFSYFGRMLRLSWWKKPLSALAITCGYMLLTIFCHTLVPGNQTEGVVHKIIFGITGVLSLLYLLCFIGSFVMVNIELGRLSKENYSNPEDYSVTYARYVVIIPILHIGISWAGAIVGTRDAVGVALLVQSALNVIFLIGALSPHRAQHASKFDLTETKNPEAEVSLSDGRRKEILDALHRLMDEEQVFLDSHLTLSGLSRRCGVNRTYVSRVMNDSLGGFFNYVNRCRLSYADRLKQAHPEMSVDEVALSSGFGSRQSYYNIRRTLIG